MSAMNMTVNEVKRLAVENFENGGKFIIQCWDNSDIQDALDDGEIRKGQWLAIFNRAYRTEQERRVRYNINALTL